MTFLNIFIFYSIFGNIFERIFMSFIDKTYVSGFMSSIFTPIYGIAVIIILFIHNKINIKNKYIKLILEFIIYAIILSLLECIGGHLIEIVFNKIYWNYDNFKFNIGKYMSLETAILWGLLSLIIIYLINPLYKKIENKIPKFITIILSIIFLLNLIYIIIVK